MSVECKRCGLEKPYTEFPNGSDSRKSMKKLFGDGFLLCKTCWSDHTYQSKRRIREEEKVVGRRCEKCKERKSLDEFYYRSDSSSAKKSEVRKASYCKSCAKDTALLQKTEGRRKKLSYLYGISLEDFESLAEGGCQICGIKRPDRVLVVDHDHSTKKFRGILCSQCNTAIGLLGDEPETIFKAFYYLDSRKGQGYGSNDKP